MGKSEANSERRGRLEHLTGVIKSGEQAFIKTGEALAEVRGEGRGDGLYEGVYEDWDTYCREELGYSSRHADRTIRASRAATTLGPFGLDIRNEAQARVMARLMDAPGTAKRIWDRVGEETGGKQTAASLARAVRRETGTPSPDPYFDMYLEDEEGEEGAAEALAEERGRANRDLGVHYSSDFDEWYTPSHIVERVERALEAIDLDPCADPGRRIPAKEHYTKADEGLSKEWHGRVFMNPPYGDEIGEWVRKLVAEYSAGRTTAAVALVPARTDTGWFSLLDDYPRCHIRGRLRFVDESGEAKDAAPFPSVVVYMGDDTDAFSRAFRNLGTVYTKSGPSSGTARQDDGEGPAPRRDYPAPPRAGGVERPMLRYYGSKWNLAPSIAELFVGHRVYVEPYLGSAAVFLSKEPARFEVLNDLDDEIVNLFEVTRTRPEELAGVVGLTPYSETEVARAGETLGDGGADLDPVERARRFLVVSHVARRRQVGELSYSVATGPTARRNVELWKRVPDSVFPVCARFRDADVRRRDAIEVVRENAYEDALVYADPPYVPGTRAPKLYRHETPLEHHERLVEALLD
nr:DNA adenine methylase [Actinomycetota bacterium]